MKKFPWNTLIKIIITFPILFIFNLLQLILLGSLKGLLFITGVLHDGLSSFRRTYTQWIKGTFANWVKEVVSYF